VEVGHRAGEEEAEVGHRAAEEEAEAEEEAGEEAEDHGEAEAEEEAGEEAGEEAEEEAENNTLRIQAITKPTIGLTVAAEVRNRAGEVRHRAGEVRNKRVGGVEFFQTAGEVENFRKQVVITHRRHPMTVAAALPTKRGGVASIASRNK